MGFVGAGGIGQELVVAIRKFYYSDVSAILLMIILTVFVIDIGTGWMRAPAVRQGARAHEPNAGAGSRRRCARDIPESSTGRIGAACRAGDAAWRTRRSSSFGLVHLGFSPTRMLAGLHQLGWIIDDDAAARSRLLAAALSEGARRDAVDRAARHHAGRDRSRCRSACWRRATSCRRHLCAFRSAGSSIPSAASIR